ncbi:hypothetical protein F1559_004052 [Cyanidiococcus yangmingshanensis]|uniref:Uncharacterized protein n=1 Tax=Cyanidiococcus yangmingshanensis TaxID=2690220 RepID=A0A7J7IKY1_9RHOD|nr:hypothetical protein F1559_004052 [Cyanidiococcus yangmingshanensis]
MDTIVKVRWVGAPRIRPRISGRLHRRRCCCENTRHEVNESGARPLRTKIFVCKSDLKRAMGNELDVWLCLISSGAEVRERGVDEVSTSSSEEERPLHDHG